MTTRARRALIGSKAAAGFVALGVLAAACSSGAVEVAFEQRAAVVEGAEAPEAGGTGSTAVVEGGLIGGGPSSPAARAKDQGSGTPGVIGSGAPGSGSKGVVRLGTILPLTGGQRDYGEPVLRTTQAFVDEINANGGVGGYQLQLIAYDACLTCQDAAAAAAKRLVEQDGVFAIVNPYVMVIAFISVIPYLDEKRIPLVQGGSEDMTDDSLSPVTFATAPPGLFYGRFMPNVVKRYMQVDQIALTYLDVPTETANLPTERAEFEREGIQIVHEEKIEAAEDAVTSMDGAVSRMRLAGAQGVVATNPILLAFGRLAADRQGWDVPWYGPAAWSALLEDACGTICDDVVYTDTAGLSYVDRPSPQMQQFRDVMARRYPDGARTGHELGAWVGMQVFSEVFSRSGPDREKFLAEMESVRNLDLGTASPVTFTPDFHMGGTQTTLLKLKDGRYYQASEPLNFGLAEP